MATNLGGSQQGTGGAAAHASLGREATSSRSGASLAAPSSADSPARHSGYGLPCSKCHLYYPADVAVCPTCKHNERVSPLVPKVPPRLAQSVPDSIPDSAVVEREREEFLRQFKSQLMEAHAQVVNVPESVCKFGEHHHGEPAHADVCTTCYERLQERMDVCEAALHLDLKEAAQIIYDAVWSDPSDPGKTYQNAASALLAELRKRAGITALMGPFQTLSH
jgi:hypothetical protein